MTISSRTPEGRPNRCPLCGAAVVIEPSLVAGDAPCPACGTLLWFLCLPEGHALFGPPLAERKRATFRERVAEMLGIPAASVTEEALARLPQADSLDLVELVMELEEDDEDIGPTGSA